MLWKMLTHVHTSSTVCGEQVGIKGEVFEEIEKEKAASVPDRTLDLTPMSHLVITHISGREGLQVI